MFVGSPSTFDIGNCSSIVLVTDQIPFFVFCIVLGKDNGLHNELVYILAGEWPLQLHIAKQVYWFAKSMKDNPRLVSELLV